MPEKFPAAVNDITLRNFRNYKQVKLNTEKPIILCQGNNGAGKTNLLEAVSLLVPNCKIRSSQLIDYQNQKEETAWKISANVQDVAGTLDISLQTNHTGERKQFFIDNRATNQAKQLNRCLAALVITPEMDRLFQDRTALRRRFLDQLCLLKNNHHFQRLNEYDKLLQQRLKILISGQSDKGWLDSLESEMAAIAVAIAACRLETVSSLNDLVLNMHSDFPVSAYAVKGEIEDWVLNQGALVAEENMIKAMSANRKTDAINKITQIGTHRSALKAWLGNDKVPANLCSSGEQKIILLNAILAQTRMTTENRKIKPLLLLDEVFSHLDEKHQLILAKQLCKSECQTWITAQKFDNKLFADTPRIQIDNGNVVLNNI